MKSRRTLALFLALTMGSATTALAAGFRLPEAGAKAMGMGFAFTAQADDPSAIYFNPAGIALLPGTNAMAGVTYVRENGQDFTGSTPLTGGASVSETQKTLHFFIPNAFLTNRAKGSGLAYGVGLFTPFGLGQEYEPRATSVFRSQVTKIDLKTVVVNPTVAYQVGDTLSVGGGIDFMYGWANLAKNAVYPADNTTNLYNLDLKGDGTAWGYNFGVLFHPSRELRVGFSYRSPFKLKIKDGDVRIRDINATALLPNSNPPPAAVTAAQVFGGTSFDTRGSTTLNLPATAALGIMIRPSDRLTVEGDLDWTFWHSYRRLAIDIRDNRGTLLPDSDSRKGWNDVVAIRLGAEYKVTDPLALRLGFAYDPTPVPADTLSPELPDADRLNYMAGLGYRIGPVTLDLAYMYIDKKDRTVNNLTDAAADVNAFNGTWKGDAHLVALDLGYRF